MTNLLLEPDNVWNASGDEQEEHSVLARHIVEITVFPERFKRNP